MKALGTNGAPSTLVATIASGSVEALGESRKSEDNEECAAGAETGFQHIAARYLPVTQSGMLCGSAMINLPCGPRPLLT